MPRSSLIPSLAVPALAAPAVALGLVATLAAFNTSAAAQPPAGGTPAPKVCNADTPCGTGEFCRIRVGAKNGICNVKPDACPMIYQPVCGDNGKTYPNDCHAAQAGAGVVHKGECKPK